MKHTNRKTKKSIFQKVGEYILFMVIAIAAITALGVAVLHANYTGSDTQPSIIDQAIEQVAK